MVYLKAGDRVDCKIKHGIILNQYETDYKEVRTFEIIASDNREYYLYVPEYFMLKNTKRLDCYTAKDLSIDKRFVGDEYISIKENMVYNINYVFDGHFCDRCKKFYPMAYHNSYCGQFLCWGCLNIANDE